MASKMTARQRFGILLSVIALAGLTLTGCEVYTTPIPAGEDWLPDSTAQGSAQEIYATQSAGEMDAIQAHQATATALAENYYATITADQARLEQQRLADAQQAAATATAATATAQAAEVAIIATATERAYQATATQQAQEWEAQVKEQSATATAQAVEVAIMATATERAYQATATQQAQEWEAQATRVAEEAQTTATADRAQVIQTEQQAEAIRQMQREEQARAYWRNYGLPVVLVALLICMMVLITYILRPIIHQGNTLQDAPPPPLVPEGEGNEETQVQLKPIPLPMPSATGLRSVRILRGLDQARRADFLSDTLLDSLEAAWRRIEEGTNEPTSRD